MPDPWACAVCRKPVTPKEHHFFEGSQETAVRRWTVVAPEYFKLAPDGRSMEAGFCSPKCALAYFGAPTGALGYG